MPRYVIDKYMTVRTCISYVTEADTWQEALKDVANGEGEYDSEEYVDEIDPGYWSYTDPKTHETHRYDSTTETINKEEAPDT